MARYAPGGLVYHVLNRGVGRQQLFFSDDDYLAFERVIVETLEKHEMRILSYCSMPNHWHFVLWPANDGDLARFMQRLTITHVTRWQKNYNMVGYGHMYQGRFKSFPVESDDYFYQVMRYTERNALRANLVSRVAMGQFVDSTVRIAGTPCHAFQLAYSPSSQLGPICERARERFRT